MTSSREASQGSIPALWADRKARHKYATRAKSPHRDGDAEASAMDEDLEEAAVGAAGGPEKATDLLEAFTMRITKRLDTRLGAVVDKIAQLVETVKDHAGRIEETEVRVSDLEDTLTSVSVKMEKLERQQTQMLHKLDDIENRTRRNNLRIVGLQEKAEGRDAVGFITKWLPQLLNLTCKAGGIKIDRAHRTAAPPPLQNGRPRAMIVRLHNFQDKQRILNAARTMGALTHNGERIMIFADFSPELQKQRQMYTAVKREFAKMGVKYALIYPAKLRVVLDNKAVLCDNVEAAEKLLAEVKNNPPRSAREISPSSTK